MSYDLVIRSDDEYSQATPYEALKEFIAGLPNVVGSSFRDDERDMFMNIDLEFNPRDGSGDLISGSQAGQVNIISLHISYSKLHDDARDDEYIDLAYRIARHLGWKVYDCLQDEYIT